MADFRDLTIVFRCKASHALGLGHLTRCTAIAERVQALSPDCKLVLHADVTTINLADKSHTWFKIINSEDIEIEALLKKLNADACVLDGYEFTSVDEAAIANHCELLRIDDGQLCSRPEHERHHADIILNSAPQVTINDYIYLGGKASSLSPGFRYASLWLGPAYHPLRTVFTRPQSHHTERDSKTLIVMGGSDPLTLTYPLILQLHASLPLRVICGPAMDKFQLQQISSFCERHAIEHHHNPGHLAELMARSHQAISAAGSSIYELAALNTPMIAIQVADNQRFLVNWLKHQGVTVLSSSDLPILNNEDNWPKFRVPPVQPSSKLDAEIKRWLQHLSSK